MEDNEHKAQDVSRKMKVGNVAARAKRKQAQTVAPMPSIVPWKPIGKWALIAVIVCAVVGAGSYAAYRIATAPPPIDLEKCPLITEVAGAATVVLPEQKEPAKVGNRILPSSQLSIGQSSSVRVKFPDGNVVSLYSGSMAKMPDDFSTSLFLQTGNAYIEASGTSAVDVRSPHGVATCLPGSSSSIEVARSRCRVDVQTGHVQLESTGGKRRMVILAESTGEVGTGAVVGGIKSSEAHEDITYPGLEIAQVSMYDAAKDHVLTAFDPMKDGSIFHHIAETTPILDFRVIPNSTKSVQLETELFRIENGKLVSLTKSRTEPIEGEARIYAAFGATVSDKVIDYKGYPVPLGDYQVTFRPFADDKTHGIGNGTSLTLRFSIDDKREHQE